MHKYSNEVPEDSDDPIQDAAEWLTNLLYTGVGLGILAMNKAQVAKRDLEQHFSEAGAQAPDLAAIQDILGDPERTARVLERLRVELQDVDDRLDGVEHRFSAALDSLEPDLPPAARDLSQALRGLVNEHASQLRSALGLRQR